MLNRIICVFKLLTEDFHFQILSHKGRIYFLHFFLMKETLTEPALFSSNVMIKMYTLGIDSHAIQQTCPNATHFTQFTTIQVHARKWKLIWHSCHILVILSIWCVYIWVMIDYEFPCGKLRFFWKLQYIHLGTGVPENQTNRDKLHQPKSDVQCT